MREFLSVGSDGGLELELPLASPLPRALAYLIDLLVLGLVGLVIGFVGLGTKSLFESDSSAVLGLLVLLFFVLQWSYFLAFEWAWSGITPGKALLGIRVVHAEGRAARFEELAIRNLLRGIDMLPPPLYLLGALVGLFHPLGRRLGDIAAGTVVVHERIDLSAAEGAMGTGAAWAAKVGRGASRSALLLPGGALTLEQLVAIETFLARRSELSPEAEEEVAMAMVGPLLELRLEPVEPWMARPHRLARGVALLEEVRDQANANPEQDQPAVDERKRAWREHASHLERLRKGGRAALAEMSPGALSALLRAHRRVVADLARAIAFDADPGTRRLLGNLAAAGHLLLHVHRLPVARVGGWRRPLAAFRAAVGRCRAEVGAAAVLLFGSGALAWLFVQQDSALAYDLVPLVFQNFQPARQESMHDIPSLARPLAASRIIANNVQVTFLAFGFGMSFGVGTALLLVMNGMQIGAAAGWFQLRGMATPFWGFVAPHGVTELLAIVLAGGAGLRLGRVLVLPGAFGRAISLRRAALDGLAIVGGCMAMLGVAGLIEGFVSPSHLSLSGRLVFAGVSALAWLAFFGLGPRLERGEEPAPKR